MKKHIENQTIEHDDFDCSYEELQELAKKKALEIEPLLNLKPNEYGSFGIWTNGVPELICIAEFSCDTDGKVTWAFDDSESTLDYW